MGLNLYPVAKEYVQIMEDLASDPTLDAQTIKDTLEGAAGDVEARVHSAVAQILNLKAESEAAATEAKIQAKRAEDRKQAADNLRYGVGLLMHMCGMKKIIGPLRNAVLMRNPYKLVRDKLARVPDEYLEVNPLVQEIVTACIKESGRTDPDKPLVLTVTQLRRAILGCLPEPGPDNEAIMEVLKPWFDRNEGLAPDKRERSPIPGCDVERKWRADLK